VALRSITVFPREQNCSKARLRTRRILRHLRQTDCGPLGEEAIVFVPASKMSREIVMLRKITSIALIGAVSLAPVAQACTGIALTAKDGGVVAARTLEFGIDPKSDVLVVPPGTAITGTLPDGGKGVSYVTKYGVVGANGFGQTVILDGINEAGLYVGLFSFPRYASLT